jgi:hypothetical protein
LNSLAHNQPTRGWNHPDPAEVYADNVAAEVDGTPIPSALRALGLTAVFLRGYYYGDNRNDYAALGRAVCQAIDAYGCGDLPVRDGP